MLLSNFTHFIRTSGCINSLELCEDWIVCSKCKKKIGFIFPEKGHWKVYLFALYKKYAREIKHWINDNIKEKKCVEQSYEQEWENVTHDIKEWCEECVLPVIDEEKDRNLEEGGENEG